MKFGGGLKDVKKEMLKEGILVDSRLYAAFNAVIFKYASGLWDKFFCTLIPCLYYPCIPKKSNIEFAIVNTNCIMF